MNTTLILNTFKVNYECSWNTNRESDNKKKMLNFNLE